MFAFLSVRCGVIASSLCLLPVLSVQYVLADDCALLAETAYLQDKGHAESGTTTGQGGSLTDLGTGWRFKVYFSQHRLSESGADRMFAADAGRHPCGEDLSPLRMNDGFHYRWGSWPVTGIVASQDFGFVHWQAGITRNTAIYTTRYSSALLFNDLVFPLVLEAMADKTRNGWNRWRGGALYLLSSRHFDLGISYSHGDGARKGERLAMIRMTMVF